MQPSAVASATPAVYAQYQILSGTTRLAMAAASLSAPPVPPTKAAGPATPQPPAPLKQAAAASVAPSTDETSASALATPLTPFTPVTPEPVAAQPVQKGSTREVAVQAPEPEPETAPLAPSLPTTGSTSAVQSPAPVSNPVALSVPVSVPSSIAKTRPSTGMATVKPAAVAIVQPAPAVAPIPQPVRRSVPIAQPATKSATEKLVLTNPTAPQSGEAATAAPAIVEAPVNNNDPIELSLPMATTPQAAPPPPSRGAAKAPLQSRSADPIVTPVPAPPASATESLAPVAPVSPVEKQSEPKLASVVTVPVSSSPSPLPVHEAVDRTSEPSGLSTVQHEALPVTDAPKAPVAPVAENFAFALRMLGLETSSSVTTSDTPVTPAKGPLTQPQASSLQQQPTPSQGTQTASAPHETQSSAAAPEPVEKPDVSTPNQPDVIKAQPTPATIPHWNEMAVAQAPEMSFLAGTPESRETAARPALPLAAQETHLMAPELPKTSSSSEILLHLTGNDESSAAIRVADRAGSVNVSVHTSDPVLRESLRSNLGELSTQLNAQGWKADVIKSAATAAHPESQQDSHTGGQRGSQQQSPGGERQPQRDRRSSGGQWQQELDQQITGGDAYPGGNG